MQVLSSYLISHPLEGAQSLWVAAQMPSYYVTKKGLKIFQEKDLPKPAPKTHKEIKMGMVQARKSWIWNAVQAKESNNPTTPHSWIFS